ncbi:hypothetical protein MalM25_05680 [Planctomycetes bacterium MalM25]|nr:hypothetical protein MalM25_05680 [Planctomycetes bacterium MalM25]
MSAELVEFMCTVSAKLDQIEHMHRKTTPIIGDCQGCGRYLPWPSPRAGAWVAPVACPQCRRWYYCESRNDTSFDPDEMEETLRASLVSVSQANRPSESAAVATVRESLIGDEVYFGAERRGATRVPVSATVVVAPLDERFVPVAMAQQMTLIDFSIHGAGFMGRAMEQSEYALVDFSPSCPRNTQLMARVVSQQQLDDFAKYGCEFVVDVAEL